MDDKPDTIKEQIILLQKKLKEMTNKEKVIKNLAFSGGSSKGFSYIGVIKALEEYGIIDTVEDITGSSIGALFAFLIILKFHSSDLINIFIEMDLNWLHNINSDSVLILINKYGLDNGYNVEKFIAHFLEVRFPNKNPFEITFLDLWNFNPIKLSITGTRIYNNIIEQELFNHILTPTMSIIKALRITMAIPPLFTPIDNETCHLADGGIYNNYPIDVYANNMENTIGILCIEKISKEKCKNITDIYKSIIGYLIARETLEKKTKYFDNSIVLEVELPLYQIFNLTTEDKTNIINLGYQLTKQYLNIKEFKIKEIEEFKDFKIDTKIFSKKLESALTKNKIIKK